MKVAHEEEEGDTTHLQKARYIGKGNMCHIESGSASIVQSQYDKARKPFQNSYLLATPPAPYLEKDGGLDPSQPRGHPLCHKG